VAIARLRTRVTLRDWGLEELSDDAEQVVGEIVANAVEAHRRDGLAAPVRLTLLSDSESVLVMVRDLSSGRPVRDESGLDRESGRGLIIVGELAEWWDWHPVPRGGKVVRSMIRGESHAARRGECRHSAVCPILGEQSGQGRDLAGAGRQPAEDRCAPDQC
jgi:anti-sigma regulatory factor (Ser/Thr protein kinase)